MQTKLDNSRPVVLITGSSSGIGASISLQLSEKDYYLIVTGRDQNKIDHILAKCNLPEKECKVYGYKADLLDLTQVDGLLGFIQTKFGKLDIIINNACFRGSAKNILDTNIEEFGQIYHMNVSVPTYLIHKMITKLKVSDKHTQIVINISSTASRVVVPLHGYSISKSSLSELTQQLKGVKNLISFTISPGPVLTEERPQHEAMSSLTLIQRVGTPEEIVNLVVYCLDNVSVFRGQEIFVDGGYLAREHVACCIGKS